MAKFDRNTAMACLKAAQLAIARAKFNIAVGQLHAKNISSVQDCIIKQITRTALVKEMQIVSENLGALNAMSLKKRFPNLLGTDFDTIKKQRNLLAHNYGHGDKDKRKIKWEDVMKTGNKIYPKMEAEMVKALQELGEEKHN